ncbi:MAG: cell division protein FtsL [Burkholderiales bacterium]|nr:cell division protein FtsL [Burkholderiales bacterium]
MTRLNALLLVLLVMSSLYLVQTSYESRRLFAELERQRAQAQKLAQEADRLQVERRDQATPLRVERVAREQLGMRPATQGGIEYVRDVLADPARARLLPQAPVMSAPASLAASRPSAGPVLPTVQTNDGSRP